MSVQLKIVYSDQVGQVTFYPQETVRSQKNDAVQVVNGCNPGASLTLTNQSGATVIFELPGGSLNGADTVSLPPGQSHTAQIAQDAAGGYPITVNSASERLLASATIQVLAGG